MGGRRGVLCLRDVSKVAPLQLHDFGTGVFKSDAKSHEDEALSDIRSRTCYFSNLTKSVVHC